MQNATVYILPIVIIEVRKLQFQAFLQTFCFPTDKFIPHYCISETYRSLENFRIFLHIIKRDPFKYVDDPTEIKSAGLQR